MPKGTKLLLVILAVIVCLPLLYVLGRGFSAYSKRYPWAEMDWDGDGRTSLREFLAASDIGRRTVIRDGVQCIEYYRYKDGLPLKVVCPPRE